MGFIIIITLHQYVSSTPLYQLKLLDDLEILDI